MEPKTSVVRARGVVSSLVRKKKRHVHVWRFITPAFEQEMQEGFYESATRAFAEVGLVFERVEVRFLFCYGCDDLRFFWPDSLPVRQARSRSVAEFERRR